MFKSKLIILLGVAVALSACGPKGTPTLAPVDVQNTAFAAAFTMVAETQAAIPPTETPVPTDTPSPTPLPTFTLPASPTLESFLAPPTATQAVSYDPNSCNKPLNIGEAGTLKRVRIENFSGGTIYSISINLYTPNAFGQCGAVSYTNIKKNATQTINIPVGLYWAYAWINYANGDTSNASGSFQINQGYDDLISLKVGSEVIVAK